MSNAFDQAAPPCSACGQHSCAGCNGVTPWNELRLLVDKLPIFDPTWASETQEKWFATFGRLRDLIRRTAPTGATAESEIDRIANDPQYRLRDWDGYGCESVDDRAIAAARAFLAYRWAAVPLNDGGVQLERHDSGCDIEVEFSPDGQLATVYAELAAAKESAPPGATTESKVTKPEARMSTFTLPAQLHVDIADVVACFLRWDKTPDMALDTDTISALHDLCASWKQAHRTNEIRTVPHACPHCGEPTGGDAIVFAPPEAEEPAPPSDLQKAVKTILRGFDEGVFVRSTNNDSNPAWAIRLFPYIHALAVAQHSLEEHVSAQLEANEEPAS